MTSLCLQSTSVVLCTQIEKQSTLTINYTGLNQHTATVYVHTYQIRVKEKKQNDSLCAHARTRTAQS